jgi:hypothetical protein
LNGGSRGKRASVSKRIEVDGAELRHVAHGRRADAERRLAVNNDQIPQPPITVPDQCRIVGDDAASARLSPPARDLEYGA